MELFKPCVIDYSEDLLLDKPVKYDETFLKQISEFTGAVNIIDSHKDREIIGEATGFSMNNGVLHFKKPNGIDFKGKGFSPEFKFSCVDEGDYYRPIDGELIAIALTENPRSHIVYNSEVEVKNMSDSNLEKMYDINAKLEQKLGVMGNTIETQKATIKELKNQNKELQELKAQNKELQEKIDSYAPSIEGYNRVISEKKNGLISRIAGDNEELKETFKNYSVEQLEDILRAKIVNQPSKGISATDATGLNEGDGETEEEEKDDYNLEQFRKDYKNAYGVDPTIEF